MKQLITLIAILMTFMGFAQTNALKFDGSTVSSSSDRVATPYIGIPDSSARTIEMWIKRGATGTAQGIFCEWGTAVTGSIAPRFTFKVQNNHLRLETGGGATYAMEGTTFLNSGSWYHVAVVVDPNPTSDRLKLYLNGNLEASGYIYLNTDTTSTATMHIGTRFNGVGGFNGAIDEFRVWNVSRTQSEIQTNMNTEFCTLPAGLVSYFKFNEGTAGANNTAISTVMDEVNPGATNTLMNMALTGTSSNFVTGTVDASTDLIVENVTSCSAYTWSENSMTYTTSGTYEVTYTNSSGCDSTVRLELTIPVLDNTVTDNMNGTLTANMSGATYQWLDCDNSNAPVIGATGQTFIVPQTGNYAVELVYQTCTDTSNCVPVTVVSSYTNPAMDFDGVDDHVQTQFQGVAGNAPRTVEAWIKVPVGNTTSQHVITDWGTLGTGTRYTVNILSNKLRLEVQGSGVNAVSLLNDDIWHHVAVTYDPLDNDTVRLYVDGNQEIAARLATTINTGTSTNMKIGTRIDGVNFFTGAMDEVRIWDTARSAAQIQSAMNTSVCTSEPNLVSYFSFNEGLPFADNSAITTLKDYAVYSQDALPNGLQLTGTNSNFVVGPNLPDGMHFYSTTQTACNSYIWPVNGQTYTASGIYAVSQTGSNGCDSVQIVDLTVLQPVNSVDTQVSCGPFTWIDGFTYAANNTTATFTYPNGAANGCDSIVTLNLTIPVIDNTVTDNMNGTLTANSSSASYQWLDCNNGNVALAGETGQTFSALTAGSYAVVLTESGCADTSTCVVVSTTPTFINSAMHFDGLDDYIQTSFSGILGNNPITVESWVKTEGENNEQVIASWGQITNGARFTVRLANSGSNFVLRVENNGGGINGTTNVFDGSWHHVAVTYDPALTVNKYKLYVDGVLDVEGDIATPLNVVASVDMRIGRRIHPTYTGYFSGSMDELRVWDIAKSQTDINSMMNTTICQETANLVSYFSFNEGIPQADNTTITDLKDYANYTQDAEPMTLALTGIESNFVVGPSLPAALDFQLTNAENCVDYMWSENNQTYTSSGTYTVPLVASSGCDSLVVLQLTIHQPTELTLNETTCGNYTLNGQTYTTSGTYTQLLTNATGCDSTLTLNLIVNQSVTGTDVQTACGSYTWIDGNTYMSSTTATHTISGGASNGCDSTVTLNLTVNQPSSSSQTEQACGSYTWSVDGQTYVNSGQYTAVLTNAAGCDSVITLNLTVITIPVNVTNNGDGTLSTNLGGVTYQWYNCDTQEEVLGATSTSFAPSANGNYAVIVNDGNCSDTSTCIYIGNVGVEDLKQTISAVYPNPFRSDLVVEFETAQTGSLYIQNVHGQLIREVLLQSTVKVELQWDTEPSGLYFLVLESNDRSETIRVVKE